jgi:hypothetical protein
MEHTSAFTPLSLEGWHRRENLLPGLALWPLPEALITLRCSRRNLYGEDRCPHLALMGKLQEQSVVSYAGEHGMKREMCSGATSGMNV